MSAEMPSSIRRKVEALQDHADPRMRRLGERMEELWNDPRGYETVDDERDLMDVWEQEPATFIFELGVFFGLDYERAYPAGRDDEWPVPIEDRDGRTATDRCSKEDTAE